MFQLHISPECIGALKLISLVDYILYEMDGGKVLRLSLAELRIYACRVFLYLLLFLQSNDTKNNNFFTF